MSWILRCANRGLPTREFLSEVSKKLLDSSGCDAVEIRVARRNRLLCCEVTTNLRQQPRLDILPAKRGIDDQIIPCRDIESDLETLFEDTILKRFDASLPYFTTNGSFWIGDARKPLEFSSETCKWAGGRTLRIGGDYSSLAAIPFHIDERDTGLLLLRSKRANQFTLEAIQGYEEIAQVLGVAFIQLRAQIALRERVKEMTCLYGIARLSGKMYADLDVILQRSVELLPPGWLYPDVAAARITLDGRSYETGTFQENLQRLTAEIVVRDEARGTVDVVYVRKMPELDEGPFLKEERNLIDAVARELALIVEAKQIEEDKEMLQEQLRHADRLATIGQLAAGVAHELNEPLVSILGLAQLSKKVPNIPDQLRKDNEKIIAASLHAREVINKLKLFARQAPPHKDQVDLNNVIHEGLYFLESRCAKGSIELIKDLDPNLPAILADPGQLLQVLVNLVVNAVQATPDGGRITIRTFEDRPYVCLSVEDTGRGIEREMLESIFDPFFTTKDIDEGTGLGLSVVHGIVTSHGGSISVDSKLGEGSCFVIRLPEEKPCEHEGSVEDENAES